MAKKDSNTTFHVYATVVIETALEIGAENLEDALTKARNLTPTDFVEVIGDCNDGKHKITGVYEQYKETKIS